jgi:hypothetical protein
MQFIHTPVQFLFLEFPLRFGASGFDVSLRRIVRQGVRIGAIQAGGQMDDLCRALHPAPGPHRQRRHKVCAFSNRASARSARFKQALPGIAKQFRQWAGYWFPNQPL